jgi:hypothetical protein
LAAAVARAHTSQTNLSQTSSNASQGGNPSQAAEKKPTATVGGSYFTSMPVAAAAADDFDDFDPRGSFSATSKCLRRVLPVLLTLGSTSLLQADFFSFFARFSPFSPDSTIKDNTQW